VKAITAQGLARTRTWRLRHHLDTKVGDRFDAERFAHDVRRVRNLELFQGIRVRAEARDGGVALRFQAKDKWSLLPFFNAFFNLGSVSVVAGVYDANTLGTLSYVDLKLLLFSYLPLTKDSIKPGGNLTVGIPRLFGRALSYWIDARAQTSVLTIVGDRGSWAGSWQRERYGGYHSLSWEAWPWLRVGVSQTLLYSRYRSVKGQQDGDEPTVPRPRDGLTHAWGLSVTLGHLTYRRYLMHGIRLSLGVSGSARWLGSDSSYASVTGDFKAFYNLGPRAGNLGLWLHGGYREGGRYADLFKLGSWTGLRGFFTRHFAARTYLLGTLEYRTGVARIGFPVASIIPYFRGRVLGVQAALFADGGRIAGAGPYRTRESGEALLAVGAGVRLVVLNLYKAMMRLDFAYVVSPYRSFDLIIATQQYF
jgi:outer membrane protein assembly factor BamA